MENALKNKASSHNQCIIHMTQSKDDGDPLVSLKSHESWLTLLEAAKVRNHEPILNISKELGNEEIPNIVYHRKCRSIFTMKRDLESLKRRAADNHSDELDNSVSTSKRPSRRSLGEGVRVYQPICIFCRKAKFLKHTKSREKLTQAVQLRADQTLRECAIQKSDESILAITSRDIVAAEAHYHVSCYKMYTKAKIADQESKDKSLEDDATQGDIEREAYEDLFQYIRTDVIPNKMILPVTSLTSKLESLTMSHGAESLKESTRKHIRRKLENEFGKSIRLLSDDKGKLYMVPDSVSVRDLVLENHMLQTELKVWQTKSTNICKVIDQTSSHIRSVIKQNMEPTPWPMHPSNMSTSAYITIPHALERFLLGLLAGDPDLKDQGQKISTLVQSISQDIIYAVTGGQHKPPKHLLLPNAVKTLTGNVELIQTLNKLGHGMSYSQLEENDTALCLQKLATGYNNRVVPPASIKPYVFTNLAWDNIDRLEETLTGKGTSHRVNGIAVQAKVYGPDLPRAELPRIEKQKQRSVNTEHKELDVYVAGARVGPQSLATKDDNWVDIKQAANAAYSKSLIWILARQTYSEKQTVPSWTGFNICTRDQVPISQDVIGYLPTINAPATELATVFEVLNQSELIRRELGLETIVVVMDQAMYAKATEIYWKHKEQFCNILLRMGTFHTICNALAILGKRFGDAGLKDICIEAGIVAEGSVNGVLEGKHYNRSVRVHKYIYEALMRLAWSEFMSWIENNYQDRSLLIQTLLDNVDTMSADLNQQTFNELLQSPLFSDVRSLWKDFLDILRHSNGELSAFWMSYIDMVEDIVLGLLRASRKGDWDLHLHAVRTLIPWCFAYDRLNYARYLSPYFAQMVSLPEKNPHVYEAFKAGQFSVKISNSNPFGRIPVDQTTEVTINKDTQTPGGTARFSLKAGAIKRYYITAEYRSAFLGLLRDMTQGNKSGINHTELQQSRMIKDEEAVSAVVGLIKDWVNPFAEKQDLMSISTAKAAPRDIACDLLNAYVIGELNYETFKVERLESDPPTKKFHDPMKTNRLKTFSHVCKRREVKSSGRVTILKADKSLFGRIIVMAQGRNLQMEEILRHPLGPLPWALATPDGFLRKTNKAALATILQKNVTVAEQYPSNSAAVIDGMNIVHKVKGDQVTFSDVTSTVLTKALKEGAASDRIDIVFDTYREMSIKNSERSLRGVDSGYQLQNITGTQIVRQWRNFLNTVVNKTSLITFLIQEWKSPEYRSKLQGKVLYVTMNDRCYKITSVDSQEVPALQSRHEEADGRLLLHALHAAGEGHEAVVICSEDTDVLIMLLAFSDRIGVPLFQKCGNRTRTRLIDIQKVAAAVGIDVCRALIGLHAFTGCDTVSAFAGKGKVSAFKLLMSEREIQRTFFELGEEWDPSQEQVNKLEAFTCLLYAPKSSSTNVNDLRYDLFCAKRGEIESHQLPPCLDCFIKHTQRANYQAVGRGWKIETSAGIDQLVVDWMNGQPAPEAVLDLLACSCTRKCALPNCMCLTNGLKCTDMCRLQDCENQAAIQGSNGENENVDNEEVDNVFDF